MPRPRRELVAGGVYHVWARGNRKAPLFHDRADRLKYLEILAAVVEATGWRVLSYTLMGNHLHLLIETPEANLDKGMQRLHSRFALYFNRRHDLVGHVFAGRYGSALATRDGRIPDWATYLALNPVMAGFSEQPGDWEWSSHRATTGDAPAPSWLDVERLLSHFPVSRHADGHRRLSPRERYQQAVEARLVLDRMKITPLAHPSRLLAALG